MSHEEPGCTPGPGRRSRSDLSRERRPAPAQAGPVGEHDGLGARGHAELREDACHVVAHRLLADLQPRRDLRVVQAPAPRRRASLRARGRSAARTAIRSLDPPRRGGAHLPRPPARPCRLVLEDHVVVGVERARIARPGSARRAAGPSSNGTAPVAARVQHQRRALHTLEPDWRTSIGIEGAHDPRRVRRVMPTRAPARSARLAARWSPPGMSWREKTSR